jgi:hypothetical protein
MNSAHWHLLVNHVSLFSVLFGTAALIWSLLRNSKDMRWASIGIFGIAAVFAWLAGTTGEGAEELARNLPGVTEGLIHEHEEAAEFAEVVTILLGALAAGVGVIQRARPKFLRSAQVVLLLLALVSAAAMIRTANLGGLIRHTEIREGASSAASMDQN